MFITKLLDLKNDYIFKRIFGYSGNEDITKNLITAIVEDIKITNIVLDLNTITPQDLKDDKFGVLDIRAEINNSIQTNIEMQMVDKKDIENRIMFYWSKLYSNSIKLGEKYINAKKTIIILFADYEISGLERIHKYLSKWHIREDEYKEMILTRNLEIYIIELPKCEKYMSKNIELNTWVNFIRKPEDLDMEDVDNEAVKKAKKVLEEISGDKKEQELAFQRLMYKMDQKAVEAAGYDKGLEAGREQGMQQGMEKGIQQGIEKGIQQGVANEKLEIAKNMLKQNISVETIVECTGLTKEEIEKINK